MDGTSVEQRILSSSLPFVFYSDIITIVFDLYSCFVSYVRLILWLTKHKYCNRDNDIYNIRVSSLDSKI